VRKLARTRSAKFIEYFVGSAFGLEYSENLVDWMQSGNSFAEKRSSLRHLKDDYSRASSSQGCIQFMWRKPGC